MAHFQAHTLKGTFVPRSTFYDSPFGRMFAKVEPWVPHGASDAAKEAVIKQFAETQMFKPEGADTPDDNPDLPAGYTYLGQFIDHDITFDPTSSLQRQNDPNRLRNFRTPRLDLDCVYGAGPDDQPYLYNQDLKGSDGFAGYLLIGQGTNPKEPDLPRNCQGRALIGDMRNDENTIVSQLQLAFLKLHNRVLASIAGDADHPMPASKEQFQEAQRIVRWFYQYVVWNDFVKRLVSNSLHADVLKKDGGIFKLNTLFYKWKQAPYIPVEFSVAAYRFGHSLVRPGYQVNATSAFGFNHELPIFAAPGTPKPDDREIELRGFRRLPASATMQWDWFFQLPSTGGPFPQPSQKIDPILARSVFHIPGGPDTTNPLATLNIRRGWRMELPSGIGVAKAMGVTPLDIDPTSVENELWVYILKEADSLPAQNKGKMLGPVGGRIVAEVFAGLLKGDPLSYVNCDPNWTPAGETHLSVSSPTNGGDWEVADLLLASGVPTSIGDINDLLNS